LLIVAFYKLRLITKLVNLPAAKPDHMIISQPCLKTLIAGCIIMSFLSHQGISQSTRTPDISDPAGFQSLIEVFDAKTREELIPLVETLQTHLTPPLKDPITLQARSAYLLVRYQLKYPEEANLDLLKSWVDSLPLIIETENDIILVVRTINNLGVALKRVSRISESQEAYYKAIAILNKMSKPDQMMLGSLYANVGNIYRQKGEYERSLSFLEQAISAFSACISDPERTDKPYKNKAQSLNNVGLVYQNLNRQDQAIQSFYECIGIIEAQNIESEDMAYTNLTNSLIETDRLHEADSICRVIYDMRKKDEKRDRIYFLASINLAQLQAQLYGDTLGAVKKFDGIRNEINNLMPLALDLKTESVLLEADLLRGSGKFDAAIKLAEKAILEIMIAPDQPVLKENPQKIRSYWSSDLINLMLSLAGTYKDLGLEKNDVSHLRTSVKYYQAVTILIDSVRSGLQFQSSQMELSRRQEGSFDQMVGLAYRLYQMTNQEEDLQAFFEFIELSKSAGLWSSIRESGKKRRILSEEDRTKEQKINHQIADIQSLINEQLTTTNPIQGRVGELQDLNFALNQKKDSLMRTFSKKYPELMKAGSEPVLVSLDEARRKLEENQLLLQFSYTTEAIYSIAVTSGTCKTASFPLDSTVRKDLRFLIEFMKGGYSSFDKREKQEFQTAASRLYHCLLGPYEDLITNKDLIITPDGPLNLIPFEALIAPAKDKTSDNYHSFNYLIRGHTISYALSATLLYYKPLGTQKPEKGILAVAPLYDPSVIGKSEILRGRSDALPLLKGTVEEARSAHKLLRGKLLTGAKARESTFKSICNEFSVIHLAMHTLADPADPGNTSLVFTPDADHNEDGLLYSHEIYNLDLGASLVVLSACETGSGEMAAGEGIMSLGRGFLFAGCPNMIFTLWTVDDESGKSIMKSFYRNIKSGQTVATSLRNSKLDYIDSADEIHAHPHFWAAFSAIGPDLSIDLDHGNMRPWYFLLFGMIGFAGVFILAQKRKSPPGGGDMSEMD